MNITTCARCQKINAGTMSRCLVCGATLIQDRKPMPSKPGVLFCRHCGQPISSGVRFCNQCGGERR